MRIEIPIKTVSLMNMREHFRVTAKRKKEHRDAVAWALQGRERPSLPVVVTFTRVSPGTLDAHDNLPSSMKNVCDEVAKWLGIDDSDELVTWKYAQQKCKRGEFGVILEINHAP